MQNFLQELIVGNVFAFMLIFMRLGIALMIMPGIGDSFVSPTVRLLFALALSFVLTPVLAKNLPPLPDNTAVLLALLVSEAFIGLFMGVVMRILVSALDTAGSIVSMQAGLSASLLFNPTTQAQGSIMSAVYSSLGVTIMLMTDLHHAMFAAVVESYQLYPANAALLDTGAVLKTIAQVADVAFRVGVQIAFPFIIAGTLAQIGFGVLSRLMPQAQIFFLTIPAQIMMSFLLLAMTLSAGILFWLDAYDTTMFKTLSIR